MFKMIRTVLPVINQSRLVKCAPLTNCRYWCSFKSLNSQLISNQMTSLGMKSDFNQYSPLLCNPQANFHCGSAQRGWFTPKDDVTFWGKTLTRLGFTQMPKSLLKKSGFLIYCKIADEIDYLKFFKNCNLPDTYASWYSVVELHIWLVAARLMQDGDDGKLVRNFLIKAFFEDNEMKSKKLEGAIASARRREMKILGEQFYAALISYDEGLLGDDYILAGALWRRFLRGSTDTDSSINLQPHHFSNPSNHAELVETAKALEMLVMYVRSQFYMLNNLSREQLIRKRAITWAPFDESLFKLVSRIEAAPASKVKTENLRISQRQ